MSQHKAYVSWARTSEDFSYENYDRSHSITFEGGQKLTGSAAKDFHGRPELANPEELLAAAASSCHMLTFLAICARKRMVVNSYKDEAIAILDKNHNGKMSVTEILLSPTITFQDPQPDAATVQSIHEKSHRECFIAQSLSCPVNLRS